MAQNGNATDEGDGVGRSLGDPQQVAGEMARAFQELAKGEQTASALEKKLDGIESRIDALLAAAEEAAQHKSDGQEKQTGDNTSAE